MTPEAQDYGVAKIRTASHGRRILNSLVEQGHQRLRRKKLSWLNSARLYSLIVEAEVVLLRFREAQHFYKYEARPFVPWMLRLGMKIPR